MTVDGGAFGERLRACRAAAGLSQEELAGRSGVSVRAIGDMERGRTRWPNRDSARRLADALGLADQERERFLSLARRPVAGPAEPAPVPVPVMVPYRGLSAFAEQDAGLFFGREHATARVLELMSAALGGTGLVVVSGVSGAGKSSLLRAGVLPRLRQAGLGAAPEAASWPVLVFTPGVSPLTELAVQIAPLARTDAATLARQLAAGPAGFAVTARQAALAPAGTSDGGQRRVVLIVDQCEQLFTACPDARERQAFAAALRAAAAGDGTGRPAALAVLAVRADFEARLADFGQLAAAVQDRYLLTAMTRRQLRLAITGPATAAGSAVDEDLVQVLLEEAAPAPAPGGGAAGAGALPLLSHVLDQAWRTRTGTTITLADYERARGIEGAVAASAQRAYQALTPVQQEIARQVFTRLTAASPDGTDTAVPAARADLTAGGGDRAADVEAVLERFAAERLLTLDAATVAISHEALLSAWPLLRDDWLAQARADRVARARLHATVTEWTQASRDPSYLYRGIRLEAAATAAARISSDPRQHPLSQADHDFLAASHRASRRRARTRRQLTALLLALITALSTVSIIAVRAGQIAAAQRDLAVSRLLISQSQNLASTNPALERQYSLAAWAITRSPQARYAMIQAAANPQAAIISPAPVNGEVDYGPNDVTAVAFSPDSKTLTVSSLSEVQLWSPATGRPAGAGVKLTEPNGSQVGSVAVSPDGKTVAAVVFNPRVRGLDVTVRLWDAAAGRQVGKPLPAYGLSPMTFSPDGSTLATTGQHGVQLWNAATGRPAGPVLTDGNDGPITSVAFSPDGSTLAIAGQYGVQLWNAATGRQTDIKRVGNDSQILMVFSPDSRTLATGSNAGVRLWSVATGTEIGRVFPVGSLVALAFSPDSRTLAITSPAGVNLWDVATGGQVGVTLTDGNDGAITSLAFSPDGKALAAGSENGPWLWDLTAVPFRHLGPSPVSNLDPYPPTVAFSPDGKALAIIHGTTGPYLSEGTVQMWDAATGHPAGKPIPTAIGAGLVFVPHRKTLTLVTVSTNGGVQFRDAITGQPVSGQFTTDGSGLFSLAVSPDGTMLAAPGSHESEQLWGIAGQHTGRLHTTVNGQDLVAFSPNSRILATGYPVLRLWDVTSGAQIGATLTRSNDGPDSIAFSPDSKTLAAGGLDGVQLWDVATGKPVGKPTTITQDPVNWVAFSPDSKTLAVGGEDGAKLWDVATGAQIGATLTDSNHDPVYSLAFSPYGTTLATIGPDGTALWDVSYLTGTLARLCTQGGSFPPDQWASNVPPGTPYRNPCPQTRTR